MRKPKRIEPNTVIGDYVPCHFFPGWMAFYFECGHATVAEGLPIAVCQICTHTRDLQ